MSSEEEAREAIDALLAKAGWQVADADADEQHRIVGEVDRRFSLRYKTEVQVEINLRRAERLRQSVLGVAFSEDFVGSANSELKMAV